MGDEVGREKIEGSKMFSFQKVMWRIRIFVVNPNFCGGSNIRCSRSEFLCLGSGSTALGNQSPFKLKIQKRKTVGMCNLNASLIFPKSHWLLPSPPLSLYGQGGGGGGPPYVTHQLHYFFVQYDESEMELKYDSMQAFANQTCLFKEN